MENEQAHMQNDGVEMTMAKENTDSNEAQKAYSDRAHMQAVI